MKKLFIFIVVLVYVFIFSACSKKTEEGNFNVSDGKYFAVDDSFTSGFKYWTVVTVKNKKITNVTWNGYEIDGGQYKCLGYDKMTCSNKGLYGMTNTKGTWAEQANKATKWIIDNQNTHITLNSDGTQDTITSVSIHLSDLFTLVNKALGSTPVTKGNYKDGYYYETTDTNATKTTTWGEQTADGTVLGNLTLTYPNYTFATFVVVNGRIVFCDINATQNIYEYATDTNGNWIMTTNPNDATKPFNTILMVPKTDTNGNPIAGEYEPKNTYLTKDAAGTWYGIKHAGHALEWNEQVDLVENKILTDQNLTLNSNGLVDGLSSVSIEGTLASIISILNSFKSDAK